MSESKIAAVSRTEFGKGAARRTRRAGLVPAVLYGHGTDPVHLSLPGHDVQLALRVANAVLEISIDGSKSQLALAKQVQRNPVKGSIEHVDLVIVKKGEKVTVEVRLVVAGDHPADRMILMDQQTITLEVEATHIPTDIEIDVTGLEIGDTITAKDLVLPTGALFPGEPDDLILSVAATPSQAALDAELAGTEEAGAEAPAEEA
ncbi:MAG TPA: 50S ribosomal protein L25/general stress protein Ctc [Propionicimonas sp.]|nr:50S ribosomal protein L25/general stress protein Ctc [Propionicimonas sp.]HRA06296.1 50S ribosomal protein L25/general stress protein Ctc [Propionicimonas sp.]